MHMLSLLLIALYCWIFSVSHAQSEPCTTPAKQPGLCIPVEYCRNINNIIQSKKRPPPGILNYIRQSVCRLPGVNKAVCCQLEEVDTVVNRLMADKASLPSECGTTTADRIAYGEETGVFEYPWMALLRYKNFDGDIVDGCGGSLIHERYVLSAAHCLSAGKLKLDHVRLGEHNKKTEIDCQGDGDCAGPVQDIRIETTIVHPQYNTPKYRNDIGLIRLASRVQFEDHILPICLPTTAEIRQMNPTKYILTGWGTTEKYVLSNILLKATLPKIDNQLCEQIMAKNHLPIMLTENQMCAGGADLSDSCQGDSGGPLGTVGLLNNSPRFIQFGIVSVGVNSCGLKQIPSIYTRVGQYMDWITDNIKPS